jgi:nucleoside-diphosphate-sugar epimerase
MLYNKKLITVSGLISGRKYMKIFMSGGTGFVGTYLSKLLVSAGHTVTILAHPMEKIRFNIEGVSYLYGNPAEKGA